MKRKKRKPGRPRFDKEKRYMVGICMDRMTHEALREESEATGVTISMTACEAIKFFLESRRIDRSGFGI